MLQVLGEMLMRSNDVKSRNRKKRRRKKEAKVLAVAFVFVVSVIGLIGAGIFVAWDNGWLDLKDKEVQVAENVPIDGSGDGYEIEMTTDNSSELEVTVIASDSVEDANLGADALETDAAETQVPIVQDVSMIFTGDICFYDAFANMNSLKSRGGRIESSIDEQLLSEMKSVDICMVNNEFAYSDRGAPLAGKTYAFRSKPSNVNLLKDMGVDIVSLANNHVYDYGPDALVDTLDVLKDAGIPYVGAGRDLAEASAAYTFEINGRKIAYLSATQVERTPSPDTKGATETTPGAFRCYTDNEFANLVNAIKKADAENDLTIVYIHWGTENTDKLHWAQTDQAPKLVEAGADLIIGDHPHCLQNIDYIDGVPVIYSLGNFWFNSKTLDTGMFKVIYGADDKLSCQFIAAKQHDCRTDMEKDAEKKRILDYMQCISPNVTIDENGYITNKPYDGPAINYAAVQRVPAPPATTTTITDPTTGAQLLIDKNSGQVINQGTGQPTGTFVDPATGLPVN